MQCNKHRIAAGPDGQCVICRREATLDAASGSRRLISLGVLGLVLVMVALVLARPLSALRSPRVSVAPEAPSIVTNAPTPQPVAKPEPAPKLEPAPNPWPSAVRPSLPVAAALSADVPAQAELAASAAAPAVVASAAARPPSPPPAQARPSEAAVLGAIRTTPIVMFSTSWCGVCKRARAFLIGNGLHYTERDIDHDQNAHDELKRRSGKTSIPTLEVDGQLLTPGFNQQAIVAAISGSVQRRLGVDGIEIRFRQ